MNNNLEVAKMFFKSHPEGWVEKTARAVGNGKMAIEVNGKFRDAKGRTIQTFLFEVVGSNGTRNNEMSSNLHQVVNDIIQTAVVN